MNDVTEAHSGAGDSPGAILHAERRRQNFSVGDVSRHLKLSIRQVEALEHDEFDMFGGPVFVHGFLRNYAKLLGLDAAALVAAADRKMATHEAAQAEPEEQPAPTQVAASDSATRSAVPSVVPLLLAAVIVVVGIVGWVLTRDQPTVSEEDPDSMVSQPLRESESGTDGVLLTEPGAEIEAPAAAPSAVAEPERVVPPTPPAVLQFGFREESWVEVTDRYGEIIYSDLVPAGVSRRVTGQPPLSVVIGNAAGVDLQYNNRIIDLAPHTRVDVARLTLE